MIGKPLGGHFRLSVKASGAIKSPVKENGFSVQKDWRGVISFYPSELDGYEEDVYLKIDDNLRLIKHKFLTNQEFQSLKSYQVTLRWVNRFLEYRSVDAKKDTDSLKLNKETELLKLKNRNQKIIEENEKKLPPGAEEELDKIREQKENQRSSWGSSITKPFSQDEADNRGPLSDDWDQGDWEQHLGGPNF